jgi:DNA topoisomerase-1
MNLVIVESPAKARTISNFLGKDYKVVASKGHIRDLPKTSFGITIEDGTFKPQYRVSKDASATVKELKDLAKKSEQVFIATDEDREGEAIGFHIAVAIGKDPIKLPRIVFHEITKKAILHAIENPRSIDMDSVDAQQARRLLDRIVGYKLSPLLSSKIQKGLSAGRVQSSALKIVVDKEREIRAFVPVEYWKIAALFDDVEAQIDSFNGEKLDKLGVKNKAQADEIVNTINNESFSVAKLTKKSTTTKQPAPFMTSTLQQTASSKLGFSPKKTMMLAQKLYEGLKTDEGNSGLITYMRTDSLNLSGEAVNAARDFIQQNYGEKYLPAKPIFYKSKSQGAQEAHEAIRPVRVDFTPQVARQYLSKDEFRLYELIYNRFLACQMTPAKFESQTIEFASNSSVFKASGRRLVFDGFYKVVGYGEKENLLPQLNEGKSVQMSKLAATQHFTEPPARYSEASLVKKLEELGIGRPSTYAPTISILESRKYIDIDAKRIVPTEIAFTVIELLEKHFENIVDSGFTANMEEILDKVAEKQANWQQVLREFYEPFMEKISLGKQNIKSQKQAIPLGRMCPECGKELLLRKGRFGEFVACSGFPKCKYTENNESDQEKPNEEKSDKKCDKCGSDMVIKSGRRGKFLACSNYPECKNTAPLNPPKVLEDVKCPQCGGDLIERSGKRGKFYGCSNYPKCKFIANAQPVSKNCPKCDSKVMLKKELKKGTVYECPLCKEKVQ